MKDKFKFLTTMSLKKKIKNKWFVVVNIILALAIITVANIDSVITFFGGDFDEKQEILVVAEEQNYDLFSNSFEESNKLFEDLKPVELIAYDKDLETALKEVEEEGRVLLEILSSEEETLTAKITSNSGINQFVYQSIINSLNATKAIVAIEKSEISYEEFAEISAPVNIEEIMLQEDKSNEMLMGAIFPLIILPIFMLSLYLVQMIGAEINDEKTTRGMEIIIGNVPPKIHFLSKVVAGNAFVLIQGTLLFIYGALGLLIRNIVGNGSIISSLGSEVSGIWDTLVETGFIDQLPVIIPVTLVLLILSFLAYSLVAGILASMTTSIEDYQQVQMPIILISLAGYYLSVMSSMFEGAVFIRVMSYVPFISTLLSPALLVLGEIGIADVLISIALLAGTTYLLIKYGLKIYKVGILNYSSTKLWTKMYDALKRKDA